MGLKVYDSANPSAAFSTEGSFDNPLTHSFNGTAGGVVEKRYYVRNDDAAYFYEDITVQPVASAGSLIVDGSGDTEGYTWKVLAGDLKPLEEQWGLKDAGDSISLADLGSASFGDTTTYLPFWLRIRVPANALVASYQGVVLEIGSTEDVVL